MTAWLACAAHCFASPFGELTRSPLVHALMDQPVNLSLTGLAIVASIYCLRRGYLGVHGQKLALTVFG
ncbi:MAG: hypothetical protein ACREDR_44965, partial [Blastocatellia bacterium]